MYKMLHYTLNSKISKLEQVLESKLKLHQLLEEGILFYFSLLLSISTCNTETIKCAVNYKKILLEYHL